jgi:DNA-binding LacI/PurR family transcriptional regulator
MKAYEDVCREAGLPITHLHIKQQHAEIECMLSLDVGLEIARLPADERPDAVICLNDMLAFGFYNGVRRAGLRIPEDIAIVGFDGSYLGRCLDLPLTTVAIPVEAICKAAIDLIVARLGGDRESGPRRLVLPTELIIGCTT